MYALFVEAIRPCYQSVRTIGSKSCHIDGEVVAEILIPSVRRATVTSRLSIVVAAPSHVVGTEVFVVTRTVVARRIIVVETVVHTASVVVVAVDTVLLGDVREAVGQGAGRLLDDILTRRPRYSGRCSHQYSHNHAGHDAGNQQRADDSNNEKDLQTSAASSVCCSATSNPAIEALQSSDINSKQ